MKLANTKSKLMTLVATAVLASILILTPSAYTAPQCSEIFTENIHLNKGTSLGPIEWVLNIKQRFWQSKYLKNFDQKKYENYLHEFQQSETITQNLTPKNVEQFVAQLDFKLESMQISTQQMPPAMRAKVYKLMTQILTKGSVDQHTNAQTITDKIFRGNFNTQDRIASLVTAKPTEASATMFAEQVYLVTLYDVVNEAISYRSGPSKPGYISRHMPQFLKDHKEEGLASLWLGTEVIFGVTAAPGEFGLESLYLPEFQVFKMKKYNQEISQSLEQNGLESTYQLLYSDYRKEISWNYYATIVRKSLNTYFWISMGMLFI